jgi:hypothetical protein
MTEKSLNRDIKTVPYLWKTREQGGNQMLKSAALLFASAAIMGVGFRIGSDIYVGTKTKIIMWRAKRMLEKEGYDSLKAQDPIGKKIINGEEALIC